MYLFTAGVIMEMTLQEVFNALLQLCRSILKPQEAI